MEKINFDVSAKEAKFDANELFFSITTPDSTILSGNDVFLRISGYDKEEVIGHYHNVVRHPDMPRIVFKIIWDSIKELRPIAGYVKNRTKNGEFYWVFAALFPMKDRLVSIRIKPMGPLFLVVQEKYPLLLSAEAQGGMEKSGALIPPLLREFGYDNYDQFMSDALLSELKMRKALDSVEVVAPLMGESASSFSNHLRAVHAHTETLMAIYDESFEKIDTFIQVKSLFEEKSILLRQVAREVVFLSLNASVSSYKIESGGETFGILARDVRTNAKENDDLITRIDTLAHALSDSLNELIFSSSGIRLQCEMLIYFIKEVLCEESATEHHEVEENMDTLITLLTDYSKKTDDLQLHIDLQLSEVLKNLNQLEKQMMYLGYIQVYGIIEAAGNRHETVSFEGIFSQLKTLIQQTSQEIETMQKVGVSFYRENRALMEHSDGAEKVLNALHGAIESLKLEESHNGK